MEDMPRRQQAELLLRLIRGGDENRCPGTYLGTFLLNRATREPFYATYSTSDVDLEKAVDASLSAPRGIEAYVRCTLMSKVPAKRGTASDTGCTNVLWCDLDTQKAGVDIDAALVALKLGHNGVPPVTLAIHSGGGIHAWWSLCTPLTDVAAIEARCKGIEAAFAEFGADTTGDAARVLRVPGTMNWKESVPRDVFILSYRDVCYRADEFPIAQEEVSPVQRISFQAIEVNAEFKRRLRGQSPTPSPIWNMIQSPESASAELGVPAEQIDRSALNHFIACEMIRRKFTGNHIYTVLTHPDWYSGEKYREAGNDEVYVASTIRGAMDDIAEERRVQLEAWLDDKGEPDVTAATRGLVAQYHFRGLGDGERKQLCYYDSNKGIYIPEGKNRVSADLLQKWGSKMTVSIHNTMLLHIQSHSFGRENNLPDPSPNHIGFKNGVIDITDPKLQLLPHSPDYNMVTYIPHAWPTEKMTQHEEALVDEFFDFLRSIVGDEQLRGLLQAMGYLFWPSTPIKSIFFLYGPSNTGKTQIIRFITHLVGPDNTYIIDPQELIEDGFAMWAVYRKMLLCHEDIKADKIFSTMSPLKTLSDGMRVTANPKYLDRVSFTPTLKQWYGTNFEPRSPQPDPAFIRRLHIFDCMHVFAGNEIRLDIGERYGRDTRLCSLLLPVLISKAQEAVAAGQFDVFGIRDKQKRVRYSGDPYYRFVVECTEHVTEPQKASLTGRWWETWRSFARQFGHMEGSFQHFSSRLSEMASENEHELKGLERWNATSEGGKQQSCIKYRKLRPTRDWGMMELKVLEPAEDEKPA